MSTPIVPPTVCRPFRLIAFDWDGTAVTGRHEDTTALREVLERLLRLGVPVVVITGTNFPNIDRQLCAAISGPHKRRLYVASDRGSEIYGFDRACRPVLLRRRLATPLEEELLTEVADAARDALYVRTGLEIQVIYDRLNRRKIDLIPVAAWRDPPKSAIGALLEAVQARLMGAGLEGGVKEAVELTHRLARERGLEHPRITSDVKHVEVGLTDKADAVNWVLKELAPHLGIAAHDVLIGGDEFGTIGGLEGSDARMMTPEARDAVVVSVGLEPEGVPPGVIHLGGGPARFLDVLACVAAREPGPWPVPEDDAATLGLEPTDDPGWLLVEEGFDLAREREIEALFTVANGYIGTRGSLSGGALPTPATLVAGIFDRDSEVDNVPELALAPDWTRLHVLLDGHEVTLAEGHALEHRQMLDLRQGVLFREWRHKDPSGRITHISLMRLASLADRHVLLQRVRLVPENYEGQLRLQCGIVQTEPEVNPSPLPRLRITSLRPVTFPPGSSPPAGGTAFVIRTVRSDCVIAYAASGRLHSEEECFEESLCEGVVEAAGPTGAIRRTLGFGWMGCERWAWDADIDRAYELNRLVVVYTSREAEDPVVVASARLKEVAGSRVDGLLEAHVDAWAERWKSADVVVEGDPAAQRALRFAAYHLISAANPEDERVSVGARSLSGPAYKGHVFWDTEIYMFPFYLYTHPASARALLMYRYHTLPAAREKARRQGYRGALYAWESADSGEETTPDFVIGPDGMVVPILCGELEHHISADVAYAVWHYWLVTGDDAFFAGAGAEILLETARFWASRATLEADDRYHIRRVVGPDEYHEEVDDDVFTNGMAQWNLERGAEAAAWLETHRPERWQALAGRLGIDAGEIAAWRSTARGMYLGFDPAIGLFEQFQGYFGLEDVDLAAYEPREVPMDMLLGREGIARSKVVKQPDVLMLLYLLEDHFPPEVLEANFRYYDPRTGHGSSLSPSIHALLAAWLGDVALAERYFKQSMEIDLANNMGNAVGGVHMAALGGLWQAVVFGYAGVRVRADGIWFSPHLPREWERLSFALRWRDLQLRIEIEGMPSRIKVGVEGNGSVRLGVLEGAARPVARSAPARPATARSATVRQAAARPATGGQAPAREARAGRSYTTQRVEGRWTPWEEI